MEPTNKVDIKSEIYRAAMPHFVDLTKHAFARCRELPGGDVFKNFAVLYLAFGFVVSCVAGAIPSMLLSFFHIPTTIIDVAFIGFWPVIAWIIGSKESVLISLAMIFIISVYISHLRQRAVASAAALADAQANIAALEAQPGQMIDITPAAMLVGPVR